MEKTVKIEVRSEDSEKCENPEQQDKIFSTEEIKIEEMAIDGICGVY